MVFLSVLLVWSGLAMLGQALFQIALATAYSDQLQPCELTATVVYIYNVLFKRFRCQGTMCMCYLICALYIGLCVLQLLQAIE